MRPTPDSSLLTLSRGISIGVPGRDSNPGLPTHYCLSYAAPWFELRRTLFELRRTLFELRRTLIWATPHPKFNFDLQNSIHMFGEERVTKDLSREDMTR
jgi:hypothetical protein